MPKPRNKAASKAPAVKTESRTTPNPMEAVLGIIGSNSAQAADMFSNVAARQGFGTPSLGQGAEYTLVRLSYSYWTLITLFRNHWISRKIVEGPAKDMVKAWPKLTSDIEPKDLSRIDRALRKTNTKNNFLTGLTWGRLFGGAGGLIVLKDQENQLDEPLNLDDIKPGDYKGIIPFDRWAGITPVGDVCTDINRPLDFNKPEMYEVRAQGGASFKVHSSRMLRFLGPTVPTPEVEAQSWWGISVLEPVYESITKLDNCSWNILGLTFRANLLGMKFDALAQMLSGVGASAQAAQGFEQRMSAVNQLMSNQSLIPLPKEGGFESFQASFAGLSDIFQLFQLDLAGAAEYPVTRLFGRTYNGLGQTGDGDERIYEEKISSDQSMYMVPQLEKLYPVVCMSELGEVPDDLDMVCPSIRVLDEKEKAELAKSVADTTTVYLNGGIMSPRRVAMEVKQSSDITGIGTNLDDEYIEKLSDDVQSEGELGEGLFGEGEPGLNASESPTKVAKEENKEGETLEEQAGKKTDTAPAMDTLPTELKEGETLLVHGKLLTVKKITTGTRDLFDAPTVQVQFTTGEVVAYRADAPKAWDGRHGTRKPRAKDEAEFKESDHPRADNGQFGSGSGGSRSSQLKEYASRDEWPAHIKQLKVPPAWTDVKVADNPDSPVQAIGKDAKGRSQSIYSAKFQETQAGLKFERIVSMQKDMPLIDSQLAKLRSAKDDKTRNHADCMTLVQKLGVRPGGDDDTGAKVKAYGASTLEGRHVVVDGKEVRLKFIGKKGVAIDIPVEDPALAKNLRERAKGAGTDGRLFPGVSGASLLDIAHSLDHGGYKTKDFRTSLATNTAGSLVKSMSVPKDEKQYKKQVMEVAKAVSAKLGNTPTVALQSYIAPQTFAAWRQAYA